jgi:hypothetical protein
MTEVAAGDSFLTPDSEANILSLPDLQDAVPGRSVRDYGMSAVFRSRRILVGKTPNLTASVAVG